MEASGSSNRIAFPILIALLFVASWTVISLGQASPSGVDMASVLTTRAIPSPTAWRSINSIIYLGVAILCFCGSIAVLVAAG